VNSKTSIGKGVYGIRIGKAQEGTGGKMFFIRLRYSEKIM
jgi:hypothetical protein